MLLALGFNKSDMISEFYEKETYNYDNKLKKWKTKFNPENYKAKNFSEEIIDAKTNKVIVKKGEKIILKSKNFIRIVSKKFMYQINFYMANI